MKYLQDNLSSMLYFSFLVWIVIVGVFSINDKIFILGVLTLGVLVAWQVGHIVYKKYSIANKFGSVLYSYNQPTPFTTMLSSVIKAGYKVEDIQHIDFMSYDLNQSCSYLNDILPKIINKNSNLKISFIGYGDKIKCSKFKSEKISFTLIDEKLTEHKNIITMRDGKSFLWYEPNHKIIDGKHYFLNGGYFIEPKDEILEEISKEIDSYKKVA